MAASNGGHAVLSKKEDYFDLADRHHVHVNMIYRAGVLTAGTHGSFMRELELSPEVHR